MGLGMMQEGMNRLGGNIRAAGALSATVAQTAKNRAMVNEARRMYMQLQNQQYQQFFDQVGETGFISAMNTLTVDSGNLSIDPAHILAN